MTDRLPAVSAAGLTQVATGVGVGLVLAVVVWSGSQLVEMRDGIHQLQAVVPIEIQNLDRRVTAVEGDLTSIHRELWRASAPRSSGRRSPAR